MHAEFARQRMVWKDPFPKPSYLFVVLAPPLAFSLSLSLSPSHTHTHTHSRTHSFILSLSLFLSLPLSPTLTHSLTLSLSHTHSLTHSHTRSGGGGRPRVDHGLFHHQVGPQGAFLVRLKRFSRPSKSVLLKPHLSSLTDFLVLVIA